ncbi:MAG: AAA family ATPase [Acidimicrobiia bacterium]|nr:AAA family ATPase [Acidimicrobiia bacterium]
MSSAYDRAMVACGACGTAVASGARFCSQCGAKLDDASAGIDPGLRDQVLSTLRAEHRLCTVVFADMTASVRRTRDLDAEGATSLVNPLLETMVELMVRHGGRIDRFLGDGVLAVFGVPAAHEDDPIRAVRAAVELRERAADLGLDVTVGVNTGRVYFGPVGSSLHEELTVMGPVVNLAARFQGSAGAGEVIVGRATREHIHAAFDLTPRTLDIKGIDEPVEAFSVERLARDPEKVRGLEGLVSNLVGRQGELDTLLNALDGSTHTIAVVGEAGLGKSRLSRELCARTRRTWIEGRCGPLTHDLPFSGFVDMLNRCFDEPREIDIRLGRLGFQQRDREETSPYLRHLIETKPHVAATEASVRRRLTIDALVRWLAAEAALNGAVVFLDDVQWADPLTIEAAAALDGASSDLLTVVASRPEPEAPLAGLREQLASVETLRLHPLTDVHVVDLVRQLLTISRLPDETEAALVEWASGNPFYVEELIRSLIQRDMIGLSEGRWLPGTQPIEMTLPESVESLIMSRYDRLDTPARKAGQVAAVLDRPFDDRLFREVASEPLTAELSTLAAVDFLRHVDGSWGFTHDLVKESVYASLLPSQRRELHHSVAETIGRLDPDDHETLAFHYERTDDHRSALTHLLHAAEHAADSFANETALSHVERGLERLERLDEPDRAQRRHDYLVLRARLRERAGDYDAALADLDETLGLVASDGPEAAEIWRLTGRVQRLLEEPDLPFDSFDRAEALLDPDEDPAAWVKLQVDRATAMYFGGRARRLPELIERVGPVVERHGTPSQRAELIGFSIFHRFVVEQFRLGEETVELSRRALALAEEGGRRRQLAEARFRLGFALNWADQPDQAIDYLEQSVDDARRIGDVMLEARATAYRAIAHRRVDQVEAALIAAREALLAAERIGDTYYQGHAGSVIGWSHWRLGDIDEAERLLVGAIDLWGEVEHEGDTFANVEFSWLAAWPLCAIAHRRGDTVGAVDRLSWLDAPWERPMSEPVRRAVETARADPTEATVADALAAAASEYLL